MLLYFSPEEENAPHTQEVALMVSKGARSALIEWESHGSRIIEAYFKTKREGIKMNVIHCYAVTNNNNDDDKDQFYKRLQPIITRCSGDDPTILMGDLNAKVGMDNAGHEDIIGRHELARRNENVERFLDRNRWVEHFEELSSTPNSLNTPVIEAAHTVIEWIMKTSTSQGKHGIKWTCWMQLDDLNFTDDLALLSHTHQQMQVKTTSVAAASASVGLNMYKGKSKILKHDTRNTNPITLGGEALKSCGLSRTWVASSMNKEDLTQT
ncbi:unnamed protein product [Schistosoma curassoni]|uniref:Endo/exonuclease/phosphatase domain-containing protein n=1 Tax=Schistosoma curassoni TaxID=6186 RepID=A0A183JYA3_9TREM|nr:unnamed protein product [Schistosoma curassoni]